MPADKASLRALLRREPTQEESAAICRGILSFRWYQEASVILAFCPMKREADIRPVLRQILLDGKRLLLPRCEASHGMTAREIRSLEELVPGSYGIMEPAPDAKIVPPGEIDLVLVPGTAFSRSGARLGQGGGYYDRYLPRCGGKFLGIAPVISDEIPAEPHDVPMDAVASPAGILICKAKVSL